MVMSNMQIFRKTQRVHTIRILRPRCLFIRRQCVHRPCTVTVDIFHTSARPFITFCSLSWNIVLSTVLLNQLLPSMSLTGLSSLRSKIKAPIIDFHHMRTNFKSRQIEQMRALTLGSRRRIKESAIICIIISSTNGKLWNFWYKWAGLKFDKLL
jgi:hypothetical protein